MNKNVILIGNGGHAKVIADIIKLNNDKIVGFIVDENYEKKNESKINYLGDLSICEKYKKDCEFFVAIGNNLVRKNLIKKLNLKWYTAIHPASVIDSTSIIDEGTCIMANAVVNSSSHIECHSIINTGAIVEHDCKVGKYCHLSPNSVICGTVVLGDNVHLGAGSTIINNVKITSNVILGAGCCVVDDIEDEGTYVGIPAKRVNKC